MLKIPRQNIRSYSFAVLFILATILIIFKNVHYSLFKSDVFIYWKPNSPNITCFYLKDGDALPSVKDAGFESKKKLIFFHETSCRGRLSSRQACSVESAARAHPQWQINVLFNSPVTAKVLAKSSLTKLLRYPNVKLYRVHVLEYTKDTPLKYIFMKTLKLSKYPIEHAADMLRIVTLNKYGGIYLDLDMMVMKSFEGLPPNWVVRQTNNEIATAVLSFAKDKVGSNFTSSAIKDISETYDPTAWTFNGPDVFVRKINETCPNVFINDTYYCHGLIIYDFYPFYPIWEEYNSIYFKMGKLQNVDSVYTHHLWNKHTYNRKVEKGSPYERMAQEFCPTIYEMFGDEFGN